jgi:hypothetical protein
MGATARRKRIRRKICFIASPLWFVGAVAVFVGISVVVQLTSLGRRSRALNSPQLLPVRACGFISGFAEGFCKLSFEPNQISPDNSQKTPSGYT